MTDVKVDVIVLWFLSSFTTDRRPESTTIGSDSAKATLLETPIRWVDNGVRVVSAPLFIMLGHMDKSDTSVI